MLTAIVRRPARLQLGSVLVALAFTVTACANQVRIEWSTETEMNTAGFNLYRSESREGPFDFKVNDQLVPPATDPIVGGDYNFVDRTARLGVAYYYLLEEVELTGARIRHGPIAVEPSRFGWAQRGVVGVMALAVLVVWVGGAFRRRRAAKQHSEDGDG